MYLFYTFFPPSDGGMGGGLHNNPLLSAGRFYNGRYQPPAGG
jgi:hypothetical protein